MSLSSQGLSSNIPQTCPICATPSPEILYRQPGFWVFRCKQCHVAFVHIIKDEVVVQQEQEAEKLGEKYIQEVFIQRMNFWMKYWGGHVRAMETKLGRKGRLLDIGCALGLFQLAAEKQGWQTVGVELSAEQAAYGREKFGLDIRTGFFEEMDFPPASFDVITLWSVIEHVKDPRTFLQNVRRLLKPDGLLILQTPNQNSLITLLADMGYRVSRGKFLLSIYSTDHIYRFEAKSLSYVLDLAGFTASEIKTYDNLQVMLNRMVLQRGRFLRAVILGAIHGLAGFVNKQNQLIVYARPKIA